MRLALILLVLPSCQLWFEGGSGGDDEPCEVPFQEAPSQRLLNPATLACETFTQPSCNEECGPCAAGAIYIPPWGVCSSTCVGLSESACMANEDCRVARSYRDYYDASTADDFMGCYPLNTGPQPDVERCEGLDAEQCAWQPDCSALYEGAPGQCNALTPEQCIGAQFQACISEARTDPGACVAAACRALPPACPSNTTPGVANGCWTGACIPNALCGN